MSVIETAPSKLTDRASNSEIITARQEVEVSLAAINRVLGDEHQRNRIIQGLLDNIDSAVHWHGSALSRLLAAGNAYQELADMRRQGVVDPKLNPSPISLDQASDLTIADRQANLDFVNDVLSLPEVHDVHGCLDSIDRELDQDEEADRQVDEIAIQALIRRFTPPEFRSDE